jgi:hypothetical protein
MLRIARELGETQPAPRYQIAHIIQHCGPEFANQILQDILRFQLKRDGRTPDSDQYTHQRDIDEHADKTFIRQALHRAIPEQQHSG